MLIGLLIFGLVCCFITFKLFVGMLKSMFELKFGASILNFFGFMIFGWLGIMALGIAGVVSSTPV